MIDVIGYLFLTLLGTGYLINNKDQDNSESTSNKDIKENLLVVEKNILEQCPPVHPQKLGTYVTPYYYNTLHLSKADNKIPNSKYNPDLVFKGLEGLARCDSDIKMESLQIAGGNTSQTGLETIGQSTKYETLPHEENFMAEEEMVHTNMVPFYKGNITQNMDPDNRLNAHKLELYTGSYKLRQHNKQETEPFFAPTTGLTNIYGSVEKRELDRYKPSNTGKKHNELPFNQVRVGPGLNKGFTAAGSGGFHDYTRIMPKSNDLLYINPKVEAKGKINHGKALTENRPLIGVQYKYRPTLLVENKCGERNFTTVGQVRGRTIRPDIVVRDTNRKMSRMLMGPAEANDKKSTPDNLLPKWRPSLKRNYLNTTYRNMQQTTGKKMNDFSKSGFENRPNERSVTGTRTYWSNLKSFVNKVVSQFTDKAKYTRKQEYIDNVRPTGNFSSYRKKHIAYNPNDVAKTTIRETYEQSDHRGIVSNPLQKKSIAYDPNDRAKTTIRETYEDYNHLGNSKSTVHKGKAYDPKDVAKTTIRETYDNDCVRLGNNATNSIHKGKAYDPRDVAKTTIRETMEDYNRLGNIKDVVKKGKSYDPNDVARTTIKETTIDNNRRGVVSNALQKRHIAYDPHDVARTTVKETTIDNNHRGVVSNSLQKKSIAYDPRDVTRTTIRETTEDGTRVGNVNNSLVQKGGAYETTNVYANNTNRQFTQNYKYVPVAGPATDKKAKLYDPFYEAETNPNKELIAVGREPTKQSAKLSNRLNGMTNYEVKKIDGDSINWRGNVKTSNVMNVFNPNAINKCTTTSVKNNLPEDYTRLDISVLDAYKRNPLTQSLRSYA